MLNAKDMTIEVPHFDLPVIMTFNAALWAMIIAVALAVF